ncbi:hypothetical protein Q4520_01680 [Alteromonas sp. 1_MG-2023]|uniref:site-2 protease family protein n=1 Tax=Alteromonas sp. 1_MG-2023 TaxID=3062669 RepID=UPI0026E2B626|nr:site-2 protease family protein [Alteromonas sp. 1_MG-2023]MDO6474104.1 hypothetical protein [Alteromonas sp. 1_MG-2023]
MQLKKRFFSSVVCAVATSLTMNTHAQQPDFPDMNITIAPAMSNLMVDDIQMTISFESDGVNAGDTLLSMPVTLVATPSANLHASALKVTDSKGVLTLIDREADPDPSGQYREFVPERDTSGTITVSYRFSPRDVDSSTRNGPLFDLRSQDGGVMGAGVYFMVLPATTTPYDITLDWDLANMPAGSKGVWSAGEGKQHKVGPAELVRFSYYAAGLLKQLPEQESQYTQYWLNDAPFDMEALALQTHALFEYMANFYGDESAFKVFGRANPYPAGGGTGLAHSFMFGYGKNGETTDGGTQTLLAHELAHTWPRLNGDEPHALTAWYTEGTAEFYSLVMLKRSGAIDRDEFIRQLNQRMDNYYGSRYLKLSNKEAGDLFWKEHEAQRVPYGRGLTYLVKLNQQLKNTSGGKVKLDTLVLDIYHRQQSGETIGLESWKAMLNEYLGEDGVAAFTAMTNGAVIMPEESVFGCLKSTLYEVAPFELGFDPMRLGKVTQLRSGSNAEKAGLMEGDKILSINTVEEMKNAPGNPTKMKIQRGSNTLDVSFLPRREAVPGWHWEYDSSLGECDI